MSAKHKKITIISTQPGYNSLKVACKVATNAIRNFQDNPCKELFTALELLEKAIAKAERRV